MLETTIVLFISDGRQTIASSGYLGMHLGSVSENEENVL